MDTPTSAYYTKQVAKHHHQRSRDGGLQRPGADSTDKMPRSVFYLVLKPIIYCLRFCGGFPYTVKDDRLKIRLCSFWAAYSLIIMIIQAILLVIGSHQVLNSSDLFDNKLFTTINVIIAVYQAFGPLTLWYEAPHITKYFSKWYDYQEKLHLCGIELDTKLKRKSFLILLNMIPCVLTATYYQSVVDGGNIHVPAIFICHTVTTLSLAMWSVWCLFIQSASSILIQRMKHLSLTRDTRGMAACRNLWLTLADLTADLGNVLGPTLLEILLLVSTVAIVCCYTLMFIMAGTLAETKFDLDGGVASRIFFILLSLFTLILLCELGHRSTKAVGFDFLQELLRLNLSPQSSDFRREVKYFIQTVYNRYPNLQLSGFVTLNRRLLVSVVSTGITYLIVLVQFRSQDQTISSR